MTEQLVEALRKMVYDLGGVFKIRLVQSISKIKNPREQAAIRFRFLGSGSKRTYKEVGRLVGRADDPSIPIGSARARQITMKAVRRLFMWRGEWER